MHFRNRSAVSILALSLFLATVSKAQDRTDLGEVLVTAAKHQTELRQASTTATVITREEIQNRGWQSLDEALRSILSFDIVQTGGPGGISAPQMRGLPGRFMVVLVDGVRVNDPSDANGGAGTVFSHLNTGSVERIEIVRGPQSPLYGSNAASGVINIITRKGLDKPALDLSYQGGSLNSHRIEAAFSGARGAFDWRLSQGVTATDGVIDKEEYRNYATAVKLGYGDAAALRWENTLGFTRARQNFADFNENYDSEYGGAFWASQTPDPNQENRIDYFSLGEKVTHTLRENWKHEFNFGLSRRDRHTQDPDDGLLGYMQAPYDGFTLNWADYYDKGVNVPVYDAPYGPDDYRYRGMNYDLDYRHTISFTGSKASEILTSGLEYLRQTYRQGGNYGYLSDDLSLTSLYLNNQTLLAGEALSINTGLRYDNHEEAGGSTTGMLGAAWDIRRYGLILRGNYGSAFRAPAVYELFSSASGNLDLDPETSATGELGVEKYDPRGRYRIGLNWWHSEVKDAIIWVLQNPATYSGLYMNVDKLNSRGVELELKVHPLPQWQAAFNYTYTESWKLNHSAGVWSRNVQLPRNKFNLNLAWLHPKGGSIALDGYWVDGSRLRWNGIEKTDGYFKLDLTGRCPLGRGFTGTLALRNILDEDYFESLGYREAGFQAFAGLEYRR